MGGDGESWLREGSVENRVVGDNIGRIQAGRGCKRGGGGNILVGNRVFVGSEGAESEVEIKEFSIGGAGAEVGKMQAGRGCRIGAGGKGRGSGGSSFIAGSRSGN